MNLLSLDEYLTVLRSDFVAFLERMFAEIYPGTPFLPTWHLEKVAAALEECRLGRCQRLIINEPPRSLKSFLVSVAFPAFVLGHDPRAQLIAASYSQDLADTFARDCRRLMLSELYQALFDTRLCLPRPAVQDLLTTANGGRRATSVGGTLTGIGGDYLLIDDPAKPDEVLSETRRRAVNEWFDHSLVTRLNSKSTGVIILVMQRLHQDDLVAHVLEQEEWTVLSFPAIAEQEEVHEWSTPYGRRRLIRRAGEVLHPEREPRAALERLRQTMGAYHFAGQYQQAPAPFGGGMVKDAWFRWYEPEERSAQFDLILQSWDTANSVQDLSGFSVGTTWGVLKDGRIYLLHVYRKRVPYPDLKRAVHEHARLYRPDVILIEDKASGISLIQDLLQEGLQAVTRYEPFGDKAMRMDAQTGVIENGFVYLPRQAPWLAEYLQELTTFPHSKFKDQTDSTSQALDWIKKRGQEPAMLTWIRGECEKMQHATARIGLPDPSNRGPSAPPQPKSDLYEEYKKNLQMSLRPHRICAYCQQVIDPPSYIAYGDRVYHLACDAERARKGQFG